ncbi:hypothetical protein [Vibrio sagamiensis]|uniref:Uncharacterized protein n=1 Tax=Vibrio sagamiensis NBRC 104589 TaxID=1219064 RepID=A0A511QEA1_9VIBR|nr:hypothetical protein [Vibrio sagamiensis]PNQ53864.1 hypothetical protein C1141_18965 [Vibrio agarivorans]GEM75517.1 hypothetical protein VSA01S_16290 [Vibrio sagamiensis NBRC 104589]
MSISSINPAITNAIRNEISNKLQSDKVNSGEEQRFPLNLGTGKDYTITVDRSGQVSATRDLGDLSGLKRIMNAVSDFFSRVINNNESAQIKTEVQKQIKDITVQQIKDITVQQDITVQNLVKVAFNQTAGDFKNATQFLKPDTDPSTATFDDVTDANKKRLGLENMDSGTLEFIYQNFSSFIMGKDAIFSRLTDEFLQQAPALAGDPKKLIELRNQNEDLNHRANAEFNAQFIAPYNQQKNQGLQD